MNYQLLIEFVSLFRISKREIMTVVSSKEFASHQDKYFEMAMNEQVCIQKDNNMFHLIYKNTDEMHTYHDASVYDEVLEPDEDFYRAISMDEFIEKALVMVDRVDKMYAKK
jgi:hypothetical protein